ncbi:NAD-dependent epimerase/dehydratase family protein [Endozoicomonas sp. 2B-B]
MKILITGSSGFLGTSLCSYLVSLSHELVCLNSRNCDLRNSDSLKNFTSQKFDYLFHLAAWTQAGEFCIHYPGEQWIINQHINTNVLDWWASYQQHSKLIMIGTSCGYAPDIKHTETNYMEGQPIDSLYTYAMTKRMLYEGARALNKQYGLDYLYVVPSTLYGPGYHTDGRQMHFIFDLIRKIIRGKEYGYDVVLWGDGHQKRELIFIDDFVHILWKLTEQYNNDIFNIGTGKEFTIRYYAKLICDEVDFPLSHVNFDTERYVGAKSKFLDIDKLSNVLDDYEFTSLKSGIKSTINWFYRSQAYKID